MKSALLVLDLQNSFVHDDGASGKGPLGEQVRSRNILENAARAIAKARAADAPVIFVRVGFSPDYCEAPPASPIFGPAREYKVLTLGEFGTEIHPSLDFTDADTLITKHRISAFYGTPLDVILRAQGIGHLVLFGVSTTAVVQATTRDGHDRDYVCTVLEDGCAAHSDEEHDASITMLKRFATVSNSNDLAF